MALERFERRPEGDGQWLVVRNQLTGDIEVGEVSGLRSLRETDSVGREEELTETAGRHGTGALGSQAAP